MVKISLSYNISRQKAYIRLALLLKWQITTVSGNTCMKSNNNNAREELWTFETPTAME